MKAHTRNLIKRWLTAALSVTIALSAFADTAFVGRAADEDDTALEAQSDNDEEISSAENELSELEKKQRELDEKIKATEGSIADEEEHKKAISDQILCVEDTLHALAASVTELDEKISVSDNDITAMEADVDSTKNDIEVGIGDLKQRLRVMYIAGNNTYTDILVGASDFYDMLMKLELIKRVADHDNAELDCLIALKEKYEKEKAELEVRKAALEDNLAELQQRRKQQQAQMEKLKGLYQESQASITMLSEDKANYEANREQIEKEHAEFESQLQDLFEKQQAIAAAKKEEEARQAAAKEAAAEKAAKKKAKEEAARKKALEEAAKAADTADEDKPDAIVDNENTDIYIDDNGTEDEGGNSNNADDNTDVNIDTGDDNGGYIEDNAGDEDPYDDGSGDDYGGSGDNGGSQSSGGTDPNAAYGYTPKSRFTWPVPGYYNISYGVGWRWGAYHQGIDIWSEGIRGHNIIAAEEGDVILVSNTCTHDYGKNGSCGCGGGYGNYCIIDHGDGWWTLYGHSEGITVYEGQHVQKGDVIGTVGSTGYSTGPHLHFEVRINNEPQNPEDYV